MYEKAEREGTLEALPEEDFTNLAGNPAPSMRPPTPESPTTQAPPPSPTQENAPIKEAQNEECDKAETTDAPALPVIEKDAKTPFTCGCPICTVRTSHKSE